MIFAPQAPTSRRKSPLAVSLAIHGSALLWVVQPGIPARSPSEYKQKIAGNESKIVFYKFRKELPEVTPPKAKNEKRPLRAEAKAKQSIVSSPKNAPKADRMIWTAAPEIAPVPMDLPNILAVKLPDPPVKAFVPPDVVKPQITQVDVPDAPDFKPVAPVVAELKTAPLPYKTFVEPTAPPRRLAVPPRLAPDAPAIQAAEFRTAQLPSSKLPPKPFTAPTQSGRGAIAHVATVSDAPPLAANSHDLNIAVVGLNPIDKAVALPSASSPAQFSAGPVVRPKGADAQGGGNGISVPSLFVHGPDDKTGRKPDLIAQAFAAPTSSQTLSAVMRNGEPIAPPPRIEAAPDHMNGAAKVSGAPDPRFNGRDVFMMAIQMPNITSYSGSWLMWYADRTAHEAGLAPISPPIAHRKADPKYIATAAEERVEGRVTLACVIDKLGHVSGVELVRGIDDRLNRSAEEALSKWEFYPATRKGEPVEVDVLVEIPFRLEPKIDKR